MLRECGPLTGISQFWMERVAGEAGGLSISRRLPEQSLFHKTYLRFALRILDGGLNFGARSRNRTRTGRVELTTGVVEETGFAEEDSVRIISGKGTMVGGEQRMSLALYYVRGQFEGTSSNISVLGIRKLRTATVLRDEESLHVESMAEFRRRTENHVGDARQQYCFAAEFERNSAEEANNEGETIETYFGYIDDLWIISFQQKELITGDVKSGSVTVAKVDWDYGLKKDALSNTFYSDMARSRSMRPVDCFTSAEHLSCIDRQIAFMEVGSRRCYFDQKAVSLRQYTGTRGVRMGGIRGAGV